MTATPPVFAEDVHKLGTTYNAINVWIFCVIWPGITIGLIIAVIVLWRKVAGLQHP